jgi:hypothetical protein
MTDILLPRTTHLIFKQVVILSLIKPYSPYQVVLAIGRGAAVMRVVWPIGGTGTALPPYQILNGSALDLPGGE